MALRTEARQRWRAWMALAVLVAVVGGLVLAATAAGRRTASAFPDFVARYGYDSYVYSAQPLSGLGNLPGVTSVIPSEIAGNGTPVCAGCAALRTSTNFSVSEVAPRQFSRYARLVAGRLPDQSSRTEVVVSLNFEQATAVRIGSSIRIPFYSESQSLSTTNPPAGPVVTFHVVGIVADESSFPSVGAPAYELFVTEAFDRWANPLTDHAYAYAVTLRRHAADVAAFDREAAAQGALGSFDQEAATTVSSAIHPQAEGWWILALLAALAGVATIGQALSRQATVESETYRTFSAIGMSPRHIALVGLLRAVAVSLAGAVGAAVLAYLVSPLSPVGEARTAEPSTGLHLDPLVVLVGAVAVAVIVTTLGIWPALRESRPARTGDDLASPRMTAVLDRLAAAGTPPTVVTGARRALERGRGRDAVPVGTALVGAMLAVAALCGTLVFGSSLTNLTSTPRLYGQAFQLWFNNFNTGPSAPGQLLSAQKADPAVSAITLGTSGSVIVNGVTADAIAGQPERGAMLVSAVNGRVPVAADEVALGTKTMREAHATVGSVVRVSVPQPGGGTTARQYRVVGTASFPPDFGVVGLSSGAVFTIDGYVDAQCPTSGPSVSSCRQSAAQQLSYVVLTGFTTGPGGRAAADRYVRDYPNNVNLPETPSNLVNFGEAINFPLILGVVLAVFGAATLLHVLVVGVARRRRELGLLKAIGFVRRQVSATVCWQALTVSLVGLLVGVPLGVAAGQLSWRAFATNLGVVPEPSVPAVGLVLLGGAVLVGAVALSAVPAWLSARSAVTPLLRSD